MLNINFENNTTFYDLNNFAIANNIDIYALLHTALIKKALVTEEQKLLSNFIESVSDKNKIIKSQLFQDAFAAFIVGDLFDRTFLNLAQLMEFLYQIVICLRIILDGQAFLQNPVLNGMKN